jgi:hypothetical protein
MRNSLRVEDGSSLMMLRRNIRIIPKLNKLPLSKKNRSAYSRIYEKDVRTILIEKFDNHITNNSKIRQ